MDHRRKCLTARVQILFESVKQYNPTLLQSTLSFWLSSFHGSQVSIKCIFTSVVIHFHFFYFKIQCGRISENICCSRMLQLQADAMIFVKNRLGKFYEQSTWQIVTNVWESFTNVWQIATNVWQIATIVWEIVTNVWETLIPGKIVSVFSNVDLSNQNHKK